MQAVILMAGKGTRMAKHFQGPKQLLPVNGKPVVEHVLDALPDVVTELIFVVGGPHEATLREYFKMGEYKGKPITFVVQEQQLGLAHAYRCAKDLITGSWLGLVADDLYVKKDLERLVAATPALLSLHVSNPEMFGVLVKDEEGYLVRAVEKPKEFVSDQIWIGAMAMEPDFFDVETAPSARGEYETPDVWTKLIQEKNKRIKIVEGTFWFPVNDKDQLEEAEQALKNAGK